MAGQFADTFGFLDDVACGRQDLASDRRRRDVGVGVTRFRLRSNSVTPRKFSSFLICVESVDWVMKQASAARPK